jgi:hypothetical protein
MTIAARLVNDHLTAAPEFFNLSIKFSLKTTRSHCEDARSVLLGNLLRNMYDVIKIRMVYKMPGC